MRRLMARYTDEMDNAAKSLGLDPPAWYPIIPAYTFEPDPISVARLRVRVPYNSLAYYEESLSLLRELGCLDEAPEAGHLLNKRGHQAFRRIIAAAYDQMNRLSLLPAGKLQELQQLLARLVQASMVSAEPTCKWNIIYSRRLDPGRGASAIVKVDQYLSDLAAYRDDAHLASWRSYNIGAHAWDILGVVWRREASAVDGLIERLQRRRWTEAESKQAIDDLRKRGWILVEEVLQLTDNGREVRDEAEKLTDRYFFEPWDTFTEAELDRLGGLVKELSDSLAADGT